MSESWYGFAMRLGITSAVIVLLSFWIYEHDAWAEQLAGSRLVENPFEWRDYGGTPDIDVAEGVGLSKGELKETLKKLSSPSQSIRAEVAKEILLSASGSEDAIKAVLWGHHYAKNTEMKSTIRVARRRVADNGTLLDELISIDPANQELGKGATGALRILTLLNALDSLSTMAAYKVMIDFSPRHAGVFRSEIGKRLVAHGLDVLPALIYSRGSNNNEIHMFCVKWIRDMGNPLLSEQVKIKEPRRLAQLLEAYASVNDLDTIDVTLSLTNHDSVIVRNAARKCIEKYGKNAKWPIRRLFENTFSKEPPDSSVSDWANTLYTHFDTQRLRPMTALFEQGLKARQHGDFKNMDQSFREVLRIEPMFPNRHKMAEGYFEFGTDLLDRDLIKEAKAKLKLADRLSDPSSAVAGKIRASLVWIQAEELSEKGLADPGLYETVLKNDKTRSDAKSRYNTFSGQGVSFESLLTKSLIVSFFVFLAALLVLRRIRS